MNNLNWTTDFNTSNEQMTHSFENEVTVITDFRFRLVYVTMQGEKINTISLDDIQDIDDYTEFLKNTAIQAASARTL